ARVDRPRRRAPGSHPTAPTTAARSPGPGDTPAPPPCRAPARSSHPLPSHGPRLSKGDPPAGCYRVRNPKATSPPSRVGRQGRGTWLRGLRERGYRPAHDPGVRPVAQPATPRDVRDHRDLAGGEAP